MKSALVAAALLLCATVAGAQAQADPHRAEDRARHERIAAAHEAAGACLQAPGADRAACVKRLQADCRGLAIGTHCGLRSGTDERKDTAAQAAEYRRMAQVHAGAAQCLAGEGSYRACQEALSQACGGIGVGKYCGMRHAH